MTLRDSADHTHAPKSLLEAGLRRSGWCEASLLTDLLLHRLQNGFSIRLSRRERAGRKTERRGGSHMQNSQPALVSRKATEYADNNVVATRLDELEDMGRYSVIYEIARIETILSHAVVDHFAQKRELVRAAAIW